MGKHSHPKQGWAIHTAFQDHQSFEEELPSSMGSAFSIRPTILADQPEAESLAETLKWYERTLNRFSRFSFILASVALPITISVPDPSFWDWKPATISQEVVVPKHKPIREDGYEVTLRPRPSADFASALDLVLSLVVANDLKRLEEGGLS